MAQLVDWLSNTTAQIDQRDVVDRTGLNGIYEFSLVYQLLGSQFARQDRPDIFTAVQEQLRLKLESRKEPVEVIVVDRLERPSEN